MRKLFMFGMGVALALSLSVVPTRVNAGIGLAECFVEATCGNPADAPDAFSYMGLVFAPAEECLSVCEKWVAKCKAEAVVMTACLKSSVTNAVSVRKASCQTLSGMDEDECLDSVNRYKGACQEAISDLLTTGKANCEGVLGDCIMYCEGGIP